MFPYLTTTDETLQAISACEHSGAKVLFVEHYTGNDTRC